MKIYVSPSTGNPEFGVFLNQLARIDVPSIQTTPIVVVDDTYNLAVLAKGDTPLENTIFYLDDFLYDNASNSAGDRRVDTCKIAANISALATQWIVIDLGYTDKPSCRELLRELVKYNFITPSLRDKNVVFFVPTTALAAYARKLNESFNNLPCGITGISQSGQVGMLFLLARLETVFISYPILTAPLISLYRLALFFYRRLVRTV